MTNVWMDGVEGREDIILDRPLEQIGQKDSKKVTDLSLYPDKGDDDSPPVLRGGSKANYDRKNS